MNKVYFGIIRNVGEDRFELHCSRNPDEVRACNALSKSVPCTKKHMVETIPDWRKEQRDRFGAIEIFDFDGMLPSYM